MLLIAPPAAAVAQVHEGHVVPRAESGVTLVINVPQRMLFHFEGDRLIDAYPVGVGRPSWPTPLGDFTVVSREVNPTWDVPASIQEEMRQQGKPVVTTVPPGPRNPLGRHWLALSLQSIGIHGTSAPSSVYKASTHGCVRLQPADIASLYERVPIGARGRLIYEPVLLVQTAGGVFFEAHPDIYRRVREPALQQVRRQAAALNLTGDIDWTLVGEVLRLRRGIATQVGKPREPLSPYLPGDQSPGGIGGESDE